MAELTTMNNPQQIDLQTNIFEKVNNIPPLPESVIKVEAMLSSSDVDYRALEKIINGDAALASMVLKIANSSFYGLGCEVGSIREACIVLGAHVLRNLVTTAGVIARFSDVKTKGVIDRRALWEHLRGVAVCAQVIASECKYPESTAFTAGLLHDMGRLVIDTCFPEKMEMVLAVRDEQNCLIRDAEKLALGMDHTKIGACLAKRWGFPEEIVDSIESHHCPNKLKKGGLPAIVHVADVCARALRFGDGGDAKMPPAESCAVIAIGWDDMDSGGMVKKICAMHEEFNQLMAV